MAVAYPKSTEEVVGITKICTQHKVPISKYDFSFPLKGPGDPKCSWTLETNADVSQFPIPVVQVLKDTFLPLSVASAWIS